MDSDALGSKLAELMEKETKLLNRLSKEEEKLQEALSIGSWEKMEKTINAIEPLSDAVEKIEENRNLTFLQLKELFKKNEQDSFYSIALHLTGESRESCLKGYRSLKVALLRMQGITFSINQYVKTVGETTKNIIDEVYPHRKGNIYSSKGVSKPVFSDPMVVSKHL